MEINLCYANFTESYFSQLIFSTGTQFFLFSLWNSLTLHYKLQECLLLGNKISTKSIY